MFIEKDFFQIDWRVCTSPGPHTWSPGTGPALPSSPSPVTLRRLARPTCTAASFLSCTRSHPMMCGQRMLTCEWTSPWKWVGVCGQVLVQLLSSLWLYTRHLLLTTYWILLSQNVSGFISRQGPRLLQGGGRCHHLDRLASRLRLHQHHARGSGGLNSRNGCLLSPSSLYIVFHRSPLHSPLKLTVLTQTYVSSLNNNADQWQVWHSSYRAALGWSGGLFFFLSLFPSQFPQLHQFCRAFNLVPSRAGCIYPLELWINNYNQTTLRVNSP